MERSFENGMYVRFTGEAGAEGPALVHLHGLGESGLCFERLAAHPGLAGRRQLIPDLPGYGRRPWAGKPLTLEQQADHLARWLERRWEGPVVLLGHSMGGVLGLIFCERHPTLARGLVNVEGNISPEDCVFSGQAVAQELEAFVRGGFDELRERIYVQGLEDPALRGYYVSLRLADPRLYHLNSGELVRLSATEGLPRRLAGLSMPVRYIAGLPEGVSARSLVLLSEAGLEWAGVEPSGHWPFIDRPDDFVTTLNAALNAMGA